MDAHGDDDIWKEIELEDIVSLPSLDEDGLLPVHNQVPIAEIDNQLIAPNLDEDGLLPVLQNQVPIGEIEDQIAPNLDEDGLLPVLQNQVPIGETENHVEAQLLPAMGTPDHQEEVPTEKNDVAEIENGSEDVLSLPQSYNSADDLHNQPPPLQQLANNEQEARAIHKKCPRFPRLRTGRDRTKSLNTVVKFFNDYRMHEYKNVNVATCLDEDSTCLGHNATNTTKTTFQSKECRRCYCWTKTIHSMLLHIAINIKTSEYPLEGFKRPTH